jgi:hypothetical protein
MRAEVSPFAYFDSFAVISVSLFVLAFLMKPSVAPKGAHVATH